MIDPPHITYESRRPLIDDSVPVCSRDIVDLESIDLGEYGEGLYCCECMYWWPGLDYWPSEFQCKACEGAIGRPMPYDTVIQLMREQYEEDE